MPPPFTKSKPLAPKGFYEWEAAGLAWLGEADGGAAVPDVLSVREGFIALTQIVSAPATRAAAVEFGYALYRTHTAGAAAFGAPPPGWSGVGWIGSQTQTCQPQACWGRYFAEQRIAPFVRRARDNGNLDAAGAGVLELVCQRLVAGDFDDQAGPVARIHGDLWAGNVLFSASGVVIIDPAAHGGSGLTDIAMLRLFGCPELDAICGAYADAAELATGWQQLIGLHQLHPLCVHAVTHGPGYAADAVALARRYAWV